MDRPPYPTGGSDAARGVIRAAVHSGLPIETIEGLDDNSVEALADVLRERAQEQAWTQGDELLAGILDMLGLILARLDAGIGVVQVEKTEKPEPPPPVPRPDWITTNAAPAANAGAGGEVVITSLRDMGKLAAHL